MPLLGAAANALEDTVRVADKPSVLLEVANAARTKLAEAVFGPQSGGANQSGRNQGWLRTGCSATRRRIWHFATNRSRRVGWTAR